MLKLAASLVLIFCLLSLGYTTYLYCEKGWITVRKILIHVRSVKIKADYFLILLKKLRELKSQQVKSFFCDLITIKTKNKLVFIFYTLPVAVLLCIPSNILLLSKFTTWLGILFVLIFLLGIAKYLGQKFERYWFLKVNLYLLKLCIFLIYTLSFLMEYYKDPSNKFLFIISLLATIVFSIHFLKSIIDGFQNISFYVINFIFIYLYDILMVGLYFGYYYLDNNVVFKLFADIKQYDSNDIVFALSVIQKGLLYFYSLPGSNLGYNSLMDFVPFFEYLFGAVFNLEIIGFFVSYMASKIFKTSEKKNHKDIIQN